jgi:hypothetical protein
MCTRLHTRAHAHTLRLTFGQVPFTRAELVALPCGGRGDAGAGGGLRLGSSVGLPQLRLARLDARTHVLNRLF